ncbi:hypothetical protein AVHY2522_14830 [Acidovorax sp. SUPP2522]|nr:hypothetical protein AVHY2522_14830 [Acidovorax sp. SUPP2522]
MRFDALVIGGSFAGLSAAMQIARARRSVCVVDAGAPRNRFAAASHGFFGQDGERPQDMIALARRQLLAYPSVTFKAGTATQARAIGPAGEGGDGGFAVTLDSGESLAARKLLLATGVRDELPAVDGLRERWGATVLHCPYCHGYEVGGRPLGTLYAAPASVHHALLVADWGPMTLFLNGHEAPDAESLAQLAARGIAIEPARIAGLEGDAPALSGVRLEDGRRAPGADPGVVRAAANAHGQPAGRAAGLRLRRGAGRPGDPHRCHAADHGARCVRRGRRGHAGPQRDAGIRQRADGGRLAAQGAGVRDVMPGRRRTA